MALLLIPGSASGQVGEGCDVPSHNGFVTVSLSNGSRITYFSAPTIVCGGDTRISADSAIVYEATNYTQLFRHVVFEDGESRLTADQAHYFDQERRLRAWGQVILRDLTEGSIIRGDTMVLLRAGPGRPEDQLTVLGTRPRATLYPTRQPVDEDSVAQAVPAVEEQLPGDSAGVAPPDTAGVSPPDSVGVPPPDTAGVAPPDTSGVARPDTSGTVPPDTASTPPLPGRGAQTAPQAERTPYEVQARRMFLEGSRYFRAVGGVTVVRDSVNAEADSLEYDQGVGALYLAQDARMKTGTYDLSARTIRLDIPQDDIRGVLARDEALLEGEELWLLAPAIHLLLSQGRVQRLSAMRGLEADSAATEAEAPERLPPSRPLPPRIRDRGFQGFPERPHALAEDFLLWADSVEVLVPDETLDEVWAIGNARGESLARDTLNAPDTPDLIRRDWLEGDTIVAIFVPNADTAQAAVGAEPDSASYRLDRLIARVRARSLYRLAPTDSTRVEGEGEGEGEEEVEAERLAIHYVTGDEITIVMSEGEVERMEVAGETHGIHMEPVTEERRGAVPDTTAVPPARGTGGKGTSGGKR
jgi:lipopolysaccharide export system protein LptA